MASGIYRIQNILTGDFYIGSSYQLEYRRSTHFAELRGGYHANIHLQRAFNKYGEKYFIWGVVENFSEAELLSAEQRYLDTLKPAYNILKIAGSTRGFKHSEEAKAKIIKAGRRPCSEETKEKIRQAHLKSGHGKNPENLARIKIVNKGRKLSEETKNKISRSAKKNANKLVEAANKFRSSPDYKKYWSNLMKASWAKRKSSVVKSA